jgi:alanine racemase
MAVIKANAYGHWLVRPRWRWPMPTAFAVARLEEGIALRSAACARPSCCSKASSTPSSSAEARTIGFELVVHDPLQIKLLEAHRGAERFVWIKMDTGMNRLGFRPEASRPRSAGCGRSPSRRWNCA